MTPPIPHHPKKKMVPWLVYLSMIYTNDYSIYKTHPHAKNKGFAKKFI
jgi:hypothetical protein